MKFNWEQIYQKSNSAGTDIVVRAKVFNGWLIRNSLVTNRNIHITTTFVQDINHQWQISNEEN